MKLSPKMSEVLESLQQAQYYYLDSTKKASEVGQTCETIHFADHVYSCHKKAHRVAGGRILSRDNSSTLVALEKRNLIEIIELGGSWFDLVRLPNDAPADPLQTLVKIKIVTGGRYPSSWIEYAAPGVSVDLVRERCKRRDVVSVESLGEVPVELWNPRD